MSGPSRHSRRLYIGFAACLAAAAALLIEAPALARSFGIMDGTPLSTTDGAQIYAQVCRGCHMPDAGGAVGAARYPALAKDPALASRQFMALTLLLGRRNMPAFGEGHALGFGGPPAVLTPVQIAAVVNYVRSHFGNHYKDQITPAEVAALDRTTRRGSP